MRAYVLAITLAALPLAARAQEFTKLLPEQIGEIFCISRVGNDMAPVEALLTAGLRDAITTADTLNAAWETANPGDKPPLGDGIPWQEVPDYASDCSVDGVSLKMDEADVRIAYAFPEYPAGNFVNTLRLKLVPGPFNETVWRIDNVTYAKAGDLRSALHAAFTEATP